MEGLQKNIFDVKKPQQVQKPNQTTQQGPKNIFDISKLNGKKFKMLRVREYENISFSKNGAFTGNGVGSFRGREYKISYSGQLRVKSKINDLVYDLDQSSFKYIKKDDFISWFSEYSSNKKKNNFRIYLPGTPVNSLASEINKYGIPVKDGKITKYVIYNFEDEYCFIEK